MQSLNYVPLRNLLMCEQFIRFLSFYLLFFSHPSLKLIFHDQESLNFTRMYKFILMQLQLHLIIHVMLLHHISNQLANLLRNLHITKLVNLQVFNQSWQNYAYKTSIQLLINLFYFSSTLSNQHFQLHGQHYYLKII